jgi:alanyl-tRNA synthetase
VERVLRTEEERFAETLAQGMRLLRDALTETHGKPLAGEVIFKLYDTYGFPADLTADVARAQGVSTDMPGFEAAMEAQRDRARAAQKFNVAQDAGTQVEGHTQFTGYDHLSDNGVVLTLLKDGKAVEQLAAGESGVVVLDRTPFYAESGGQVGDRGELRLVGVRFVVTDTRKSGEAVLHVGRMESGSISIGDQLSAQVDAEARVATTLNHSATHLLHAALRKVLGTHVTQKGSLVGPDKLRFDFSHYEALSDEQLAAIETLVNAQVRANAEARTRVMSYDEAVATGAMALFGEKYGDHVRVLTIGHFSTELCGGTHVQRAGDIGLCKVVSESGIASGIRRIEAVTGEAALARMAETEQSLDRLAGLFRTGRSDVEAKVRQALERSKTLEREIQQLKARLAAGGGGRDLATEVQTVAGIRLLVARLDDGTDAASLRDTIDRMKDKLGSVVVVLAAANADSGKVSLAAGVSKDLSARIKAGELVNSVAVQVGGKGGGRPDFAQAGGTDAAALDAALAAVPQWLETRLKI